MIRASNILGLVLGALLLTAGCDNTLFSPSPGGPGPILEMENHAPGKPKFGLVITKRSPDEAYVAVQFSARSTDVENDKVAYTFEWFRNGVLMSFPKTQTDTVGKLGPDTNHDPFAVNATEITWKVIATPRDPYGVGVTAVASARMVLTRGCEPFPSGFILVDCKGEYPFSVPLTLPVNVAPGARIIALQNVIAQHILGADGTPGHSRFRNFTDLLLKRAFSNPPLQPLPFDPDTYQYTGSLEHSSVIRGLDRACIDIPLLGSACLNMYLNDVDNEPGDQLMDFGPVAQSRTSLMSVPVTEASPSENGTVVIADLGGNVFEVTIRLNAVHVDLLLEPPIDSMLHDIPDSSANYLPESDLSTYPKAYGHAQLGPAFELVFWVDVPTTFDQIDFELRTFRSPESDFGLVFITGPYCNNNLGTTETPSAGTSHRENPMERPFDALGFPLYPGLISDTATGVQGGGTLFDYFTHDDWPYPHTTSSLAGGSGVGRDRTGVNSLSYAFDIENGSFSDNPNNCARPADACTVAGMQEGGVEWNGFSAACEYPNKSNNSDDATYKISRRITFFIPYMQDAIVGLMNRMKHP